MSVIIIPGHRNEFWGYLDDEGTIHIKKYYTDWDLQKCEQMPFCRGIFEPFTAIDKAHALAKCKEKLRESQYYQKKVN